MDISHCSERDICTKYVIPALIAAGWLQHQRREEVGLTAGRVMVRGKLARRELGLGHKAAHPRFMSSPAPDSRVFERALVGTERGAVEHAPAPSRTAAGGERRSLPRIRRFLSWEALADAVKAR